MSYSLPDENAPIVDWALFYSDLGLAVLPLQTPAESGCSCGREGCDSPGKHPRTPHGHKNATSDLDQIRAWWKRWPDANVGIATGEVSGLVVLDQDPRNGGDSGQAELEEQHGRLPDTWLAETGGSGRHYFFAHPGGRIPCSSGKVAPGVDIKGDSGFVVAAPSLHASGRRYEWNFDGVPGEIELASTPVWLQQLASGGWRGQPSSHDESTERIPDGTRNIRLTSIAGGLRRQGLGPDTLTAALMGINATACDPPLEEDEVRRISVSVGGYPTGNAGGPDHHDLDRRFLDSSEPISDLMQRQIEAPKALVGAGLVLAGFMTLLVGRPGLGKTWLALQLLHSVARGRPWLGIPTQMVRCGFISLELTTFFVKARVRAIAQDMVDGFDDVLIVARPDLTGPVDLSKAEQADGILAWCREHRLEMVIIDAFSRTFHGDENSAEEVAKVLGNLDRIAQAGVAVVVIHHERKGLAGARKSDDDLDALRGSSRLASDPVTVLRLKESRNGLVMVRAKGNHATEADPTQVWLRQTRGGGYETVEKPPSPKERGAVNRDMVRSALGQAGESGCTRQELEKITGLAKSTASKHVKDLCDKGEVEKGGGDRYRLVQQTTGSETTGEQDAA